MDIITREPMIVIPGIAEDGTLYPIEKMEAHRAARFHLAISAFVFAEGALLIQRRAATKYHCGDLWANTVCTHPHFGEDVETAAHRRLREELGFDLPLEFRRVVDYRAEVGDGLVEHERVHIFVGETTRDLLVAPNTSEVSETRWVTPKALRAEIAEAPERFTPWFRIYVERFPDLAL